MRGKRTTFPGFVTPAILLAPQLAITLVFFVWPAAQSLRGSLFQQDPFGFSEQFVGLDNFVTLLRQPDYLYAIGLTIVFALAVTVLSMGFALLFAALADGVVRGARLYASLLTWPYAVAPAIAGVLWWFLFNPSIGIMARALQAIGIPWNHFLNGGQALTLVIVATAWKQISYNFLFFLAGLQAIPRSLLEAASLDGAGGYVRFRCIVLPLLMPTTFFLAITNLVYAFCDTFGVIHATTAGGPGNATTTLVFKIFRDGFESMELGSSSAQSVVLMVLVGILTVMQFRYIERTIHY